MPGDLTIFDAETKIWNAPTRPYTFGDRGLGEVILDSLDDAPELPIEINHDTGYVRTRGELKKLAVDVAKSFQELGIKEHDMVLFFLSDHDCNSALMLGATFLGAVFCDLEIGLDYDNMYSLVSQLKPKIVVTDLSEFEMIQKVLKTLNNDAPVYVVDDYHENSVNALLKTHGPIGDFRPYEIRNAENTVAAVIASSATQGVYKLINISHPMLLHNYTSDFGIIKKTFSFSGLNWITGIVLIIGSIVIKGVTRIHTAQPFKPELLFEIIEKQKVNLCILQPDRLNAALSCNKIETTNFDDLYVIMVTGKPLSSHMKHKLESYLTAGGVVTTYGMTETAGTITSSLYASGKEGSTGLLVENTKAKIVNDNGEKVGPGEVGEICIQTEFKFLGYYKNPKLTSDTTDSEGFIKTGDIGYFDEDGELYIVDRKKDTIVVGDKFVYPSVLEGIITQHPGVEDCCIIDMVHPDLNFVPLAAIIRRQNSQVTEDEIKEFVAARCTTPEETLQGGAIFVRELPKTSSGKFKRYQVRKLVERSISMPAANEEATAR